MTFLPRKKLRVVLYTLAAVLLVTLAAISLCVHFVFTPSKLTSVVLRVANESLDANLTLQRVELTFFSTFPKFGLKIEEGALVSKALTDTLFFQQDSLVSFKECILTVNPLSYLFQNKIVIHNLQLKDASVYAYTNKEGRSNWNIAQVSTDTILSEFKHLRVQGSTHRCVVRKA